MNTWNGLQLSVGAVLKPWARVGILSAAALCILGIGSRWLLAQDFEREPINYQTAAADNPVSRLIDRLEAGEVALSPDKRFGFLKSLLHELNVPESSQMLVFSKTSLQRHRISPRSPRALYFNDEVYVGYCQDGDVLEISTADSQLGTAFYTLDQHATERPKITRQGESCLICHGASQTREIPGHLVRSVYSDAGGFPILGSGTHRIDQTSPLKHRWGGWYVTGTHGEQTHLGNLIVREPQRRPEEIDNTAGQNVTDLSGRIDTSAYLTAQSDIVALLVFEHQTEAHNMIVRANFQTRMALHHEAALNRELGHPHEYRWESTTSRIKSAGDALVRYLLMCGEPPLTAPIRGTTQFAHEFAERGPRDSQGRSLRDLDLERRLLKFPCSYLIYSPQFDNLPELSRSYVLKRLWEVLSGSDTSAEFKHLSAEDRRAILEILRETKPNLPDYWRL